MVQALPDNFGFTTPSSFGLDVQSISPRFRARWLCSNERFIGLDRRQSYYDCTQHDWKRFDFDGRMVRPGPPTQQPLLITEQSGQYVPLKARRPACPYRLARVIVNSFTNLLFGDNRTPSVRVEGDADTQDFLQTMAKLAQMPVHMIEARNIGGALGSVGLSWCFVEGKPTVMVHNPKHVHVHKWADRNQLIPAHVSELYYYPDDVFDDRAKRYVRKWFWYRRDWTENADVVFKPVEFSGNQDPQWVIDADQSVEHGDGECHFVWIQNLPSDDVDGIPDYHGLYDNFDAIDLIYSVLTRGTTLNLDPTLVLHMDLDYVNRMGIKKGSDNALVVGESGSAEYLELGGQSATTGLSLFESMRKSTLEVAQCVIADPNTITASGVSSVALKIVYAPMLSKCDILRSQYGAGQQRLYGQWERSARRRKGATDPSGKKLVFVLPPKVTKEPKLDDLTGKPTGEFTVTRAERELGEGGYIDLAWPPYFNPTADDQSKAVTTLNMATGGKAFVSKQTATEIVSSFFGIDPEEEARRVATQGKIDAAAANAVVGPGAGGEVENQDDLPPGATPPDEGKEPPYQTPPGVTEPKKVAPPEKE